MEAAAGVLSDKVFSFMSNTPLKDRELRDTIIDYVIKGSGFKYSDVASAMRSAAGDSSGSDEDYLDTLLDRQEKGESASS